MIGTSDKPHFGKRPILNGDILKDTIALDPRQRTWDLAHKFNFVCATIHGHSKRINEREFSSTWAYTRESNTTFHHLHQSSNESFFCSAFLHVMEKCMLHHKRKQRQWISRNGRPISTSKPDFYPQKSSLFIWWNMNGIIHYELLEHGRTTNADVLLYYITIRPKVACFGKPNRYSPA